MPPHIYPIIPPHPIYLCLYFTSTPIYAPYVLKHYPHIPPVGYIYISSVRLLSYMFPPHYSKRMIEHRRKISNRRTNKQKKKIIDAVSRREGENKYLFSVPVDGSHEDKG